ncbi:hypothetical protein BDN70DRAFT_938241 [Pholiota conissans]|uniref:Uncharacterized protein n=1 Tax=Pholiota conissans TaxID=109636 RepID=A0A9P5YNF1_9AGAR|nr:hypothetical protein BDN70DRAFT_938241 [Pholiota conissans]
MQRHSQESTFSQLPCPTKAPEDDSWPMGQVINLAALIPICPDWFTENKPANQPKVYPTWRLQSNWLPSTLDSALVRFLNQLANIGNPSRPRPPRIAYSATGEARVGICTNYIKKTLNCDDLNLAAMIVGNPPLPKFIENVFNASKTPSFAIETLMFLVHRYNQYFLIKRKAYSNEQSECPAHLIFLSAFLTVARIYMGPGSYESCALVICGYLSSYSKERLAHMQVLFQYRIGLRPARKLRKLRKHNS